MQHPRLWRGPFLVQLPQPVPSFGGIGLERCMTRFICDIFPAGIDGGILAGRPIREGRLSPVRVRSGRVRMD